MNTRNRDGDNADASRRAKLDQTVGELTSLSRDWVSAGNTSSRRAAAVTREASTWMDRELFAAFQGLVTSVTTHLDLHKLLGAVLHEAVRATGADRGLLFLGRHDTGGLVPVLAVNLRGQALDTAERVSRTILARVQAGQPVNTQDALADPHFKDEPSIQVNQMHSILCIPLHSPSTQVGALYLDAKAANAFPGSTSDLVEAFSRVAGIALENAQVHGELRRENARLQRGIPPSEPLDRLIGISERMENLRRVARVAALATSPVLIIGEPGSGRRLLARAIHDMSSRSSGSFVGCDCSVMPARLLGGTVLGRMGTAIRRPRGEERGWVAEANRGTLYLAGAETMDVDLGRALVRLVERGLHRPMGGRKDRPMDVRLLLGIRPNPMHADRSVPLPGPLAEVVSEIHLVLPPLRERPEDIPVLVGHWTRVILDGLEESGRITYTPDALTTLQQHPWPGNVRELRQVLHRVLLSRRSNIIDRDHVLRMLAASSVSETSEFGPWSGGIRTLKDWETEAIRQALLQAHNNRAEAARLLGIHRNTLMRKLNPEDHDVD